MRASREPYLFQPGYLEPAGEPSPYSIAGIFGKAAPNPLVLTNHPSHLSSGGRTFSGVTDLFSGVQTIDINDPVHGADQHQRSAANLLHPMHSEAFWVLLIALAAFGVVGLGFKAGPVKAEVGSL